MKKKLVAVIAAIVLLSTACNGHEAETKNQLIRLSPLAPWDAFDNLTHNHGISAGPTPFAEAWVEWQNVSTSVLDGVVQVCLTWAMARDSDNEVMDSGIACSNRQFITNRSGSYSIRAVGPQVSDAPAGQTLHAFESTVTIWLDDEVAATCEYHDPDFSNNQSICKGRDAEGNLP